MADTARFRRERRKRVDCTRRELGGAGATWTAGDNEGRVTAVPLSACVVTGAATAMDGIRFEWGGGGSVGLDCDDEKCQGDCPEIA